MPLFSANRLELEGVLLIRISEFISVSNNSIRELSFVCVIASDRHD